MFDPRLCLNPNHPDVKKWTDNVGKENMYKVFVQNNYLLPDYESYIGAEKVFSKDIREYKNFLDNLLPSNQYEFDVIDRLKSTGFNILGTAAFFKKTFYFKNKVTKNELAEEAFHAIVQTLMDEQEKTQIYNGGRELLNQRLKKEKRSFKDYISELEKLFPNVNKEILEQFAYEEEIAKDFVNYYNSEGKTNRYSQERINSLEKKLSFLGSNALPIAQLLHRLYERIKSLFNLTSNEKEVEMLFKKIANGGFKNTKIVNNNDNIIPSFAIYKNSNNRIIPSDEIAQMKRSIAVLAKNLYESEGLELDSEQSVNQAIQNYIGFLENQYDKVDESKFDLLDDLIDLLYRNDEELIQEITDQFEANKTIFDEVYEDNIEKDEDDLGSNVNFDENSNQQSPESRSKELKILMNTTGTVKGRIYVDATGKTVAYEDLNTSIITDLEGEVFDKDISVYKKIDILEIADEKMIYSAIVRNLSNITDEKKRFLKLVELSMYNEDVQTVKGKQDNQNTKTFINTLLKDILGDSNEETKKKVIEDLKSSDSLSAIIKADSKPLHIQRFLLALRGFNLASRNIYRVEVDIEKGWGKVADVEASSKKNTQKNYWDSNYRTNQDKSYEEFKKEFVSNYNEFLTEFAKGKPNNIELARIYNKLLEQLGIDVNGEYLVDFINKIVNKSYPILYTNKPFTLESLKNKLEVIKTKIEEREDYPNLYKGDDEETEIGTKKDPKDDVDFNSFMNFIAEGNIEFDERVIESSYKDGYGNSIYLHQLPTFTLKFGNSFKSVEDFNKIREGGIIGVGVNGEVIKGDVIDSFKNENPLIDDLTVDGEISEKRLKQVKILTFDTTQLKSYNTKTKDGFLIERDSEYTENNVIGLDQMNDSEYALTNMILYTEHAKQTSEANGSFINAPVSLGHNEASKQVDYLTIFHDKNAIALDGELGEKAKQKIAKLIKTEFDKIKENSNNLKNQIEQLQSNINFKQGEINRNNLYDLKVSNVYEGYNTGKYETVQDGDITYYKADNDKSFKGLQFSPEVAPFINETLLTKALKGEDFNQNDIVFDTVLEFLNEEYSILKEYGILDKLPFAFRTESAGKNTNGVELFDSKLSTNNRVKSFLLNYWIGSTMSNRMRYGSHNFNFKLNSTDSLKRYRMFNGATLSAKTSIKNEALGINEVVDFITYATIAEPKGISDIDRNSKPIDRADAAMRSTSQGIRRLLHGMGKLNRKISDILDKVDQGVELTAKEWDEMIATQSLIAAMKPLAANGEQTIKTGLTSVLNVATVAYDTIIDTEQKFTDKEETFTFGNNKIKVDKYGRTTQSVGNTEEIIWDNTNKVFKLWKPKPIDKDLVLYNQRMFLRGFRKEDGIWVYKGKQYEIDTLVPPTALKTSQRNILPYVNRSVNRTDGKDAFVIEDTNFDFPKEYNNTYTFANAIDADFFGQQVENPQGKVKITTPTQNIEILANEQFNDITIKVIENGKLTEQKITTGDLQEYYQKLLANRNLNGKDLAVAELFTEKDGKLVPNYTFFFEKLKEGLKLTGGSGQDYEFLEVNEDGTPKYNVNIPLNKDKMIQYVLKHFSTGVLSHKVAGNSYVLASDYGMKSLKKLRVIKDKDGNIIDYTWDVIHNKTEGYNNLLVDLANKGLEDLSDKIYDHRAYQLGDKEKSELHIWFEEQKEKLEKGEDVYFIDGLRYMKKSYTKEGVFNIWVSEAMMPKLNTKQKTLSDSIKYGTGVRIPSQDKQSAISLEWVDFLDDTLGNTIVVPKEIVQIAGSDFDIDKSYVTQYEGYWENGEFYKYEDTFTDYKKYLFKTSKPLKKALKQIGNEEEVLKQFGLVSTEEEFELESKKLKEKDPNASLNNAVLNNKILDTQRALLTSESVLFGDSKNPARGTGDTPMDLSLLEDLQKDSFVTYALAEENKAKIEEIYGKDIKVVEENNQYKVYPFLNFINEQNIELLQVFKNKKIPHNSLTVHANYQQGTIIARRGIGVTVNGLLQAIVANRVDLKLTDKFNLTYNGNPVGFGYNINPSKVGYTDHKGNRTFAIKNTLVSAATDEAKEEQLKRHGIKGDDLNVIDLLTNFGFTIDESIAIVNSKLVKRYKDNVSKNNLELKSDRNKPKTDEQKKFDDLIQDLKSDKNKTINLTPQKIFEGLYKEDNDILGTYLKIADMSKELSKVAKLIKGKKGYTKGKLSELTDIQKTAKELGLIETSGGYEPKGYFDWTALSSDKAADIKSFVDITQDLTSDKLNQMFFEYESISLNLKNSVLTETNKPDDTELSDKIEKDVNTFMIVQMIKAQNKSEEENTRNKYKYLNDFLNINKINPNNTEDNFVNEFFEKKRLSKEGNKFKLLKHLIGVKGKVNTIKNSESIDSLRLAAVSKLNPAQQDNIRNLFLEMYYSSDPDEKLFAQNLFAYFILKDGLQFRQFNISKIFPTEMFQEVSEVLNDFQNFTKSLDNEKTKELTNKFKQLWYSDIRNKKNRQKLKDSEIVTPYRIFNNAKKQIQLGDYDINKPALYLEITKNGKSQEYNKSDIKFQNVGDDIVLKLPLYIDYRGASFKRMFNSSKIDVVTDKATYPLTITEVENDLDDNEKYELRNNKKELVFTVIQSGDEYTIFDTKEKVVNGTIDFSKLSDPNKVVYIREPYYGSTIIDMTVDAGVIPAASEVSGKKGSKLVDLIEQLKAEDIKKGYIQYYENLLLNRYSPNFDKSYKFEVDNKPVRNPNIVEKLKQFEDISSLLEAFNKLTPEQKEIYKNDFTNRKLELQQERKNENKDLKINLKSKTTENERIEKIYPDEIVDKLIGYKFKTSFLLEVKNIFEKTNPFNTDSLDSETISDGRKFNYSELSDYGMSNQQYKWSLKNEKELSQLADLLNTEDYSVFLFEDLVSKLLEENVTYKDKAQLSLFDEVKQQLKNEIIPADTGVLQFTRKPSNSELQYIFRNIDNSILTEREQDKSSDSLYYRITGRTFNEIWNSNEFLEDERKRILLYTIQERISNKNSFNGKLFKKLNDRYGSLGISLVKSQYAFFVWRNQIYLDIDNLYNYLQNENIEDLNKYIDLMLAEELIHVVTSRIISEDDVEDLVFQQYKNDKEFFNIISQKYKGLNTNNADLTSREYIRMLVQQEFLGTTTEQVRYTRGGIIDRIIGKVWEFLKSVASLPKTKEVIQKHIDFIKNDIEFEKQDNDLITPLDASIKEVSIEESNFDINIPCVNKK